MKFSKSYISSIGYELGPNVVSSSSLEARIMPVYQALRMPPGQLEALTGIRQRRWWNPGFRLSEGAAAAGRKALETAGVQPSELGILIYAGVCRENSEPATACPVADLLKVGQDTEVIDIANACLGVINGILHVARAIELGQIRAGLVVTCESAREINESMIQSMLQNPTFDHFKLSMPTLTGGSGAAAVVVTDGSFSGPRHRLLAGVCKAEPRHHELCRWNRDFMQTDAAAVLKNGVELGRRTWASLMEETGWTPSAVDKVLCHQVGGPHRSSVLGAIGITEDKDFSTFEFLGNMGTAALPVTAAIAEEREFLRSGNKACFLGIGSGLNCLMLGVEW